MKEQEEDKIEGVGGWLLFPIFGMIVTILINGYDLIDTLIHYSLEANYLYSLTEIMLVAGALMFLFGIFVKAAWFRKYAIGLYAFICLVNIASLSVPMFVGSVIWMLYFIKSERVKNTFGE